MNRSPLPNTAKPGEKFQIREWSAPLPRHHRFQVELLALTSKRILWYGVKRGCYLCKGKIRTHMGSYYRDLHDKELLSQAESILAELERRRLVEIRVPCNGYSKDDSDIVRCSVYSAERKGNVLSLLVDRHFERPSSLWSEDRAAAAGGENR